MAKKKTEKQEIDWRSIQIEYLAGKTPAELSKKYNVDPGTISKKALRGKWTARRDEVMDIAVNQSIDQLAPLLASIVIDTLYVHKEFMEAMRAKDYNGESMVSAMKNPFLFDGEKVNPLFQTAMKNCVQIIEPYLKAMTERVLPADQSENKTMTIKGLANDDI